MLWCLVMWFIITTVNCGSKEISRTDPEAVTIKCSKEKNCTTGINDHCSCDEMCSKYGDCCLDSEYYLESEQNATDNEFDCVSVQYGSVYMMTKCPSSETSNFNEKCENMDSSDPLSTIPVTSLKSQVTYRNIHCASCHNDSSKVEFWKPGLVCPDFRDRGDLKVTDHLKWNDSQKVWGLELEQWYDCDITFVMPIFLDKSTRPCVEGMVDSCLLHWSDIEFKHKCESYTFLVYVKGIAYRNPHCVVCNEKKLEDIQCRLRGDVRLSAPSFSLLLDLSGSENEAVGKVIRCEEKQLYDPFFKKCRSVICSKDETFHEFNCIVNSNLTKEDHNASQHVSHNSSEFIKCPKFLLDPEDYNFTDESNITIYVPTYDRYFEPDQYRLWDDGSLEICSRTLGTRLVNKFGQYMEYLTVIGLGTSIFFLILHLIAFSLTPSLQNLSGQNLTSLCVALLIAYFCFIIGQFVQSSTEYCVGMAILTHYAFLSSFSWMLTVSFDIWRSLKLATSKLRISSGKQYKKFIYYSVWSWTAPLFIVIAAIVVDLAPNESVDLQIRPLFGVHSCWFGHRQALLIFFAIPLAIVMVLNMIFFASSAHMILSTSSNLEKTTCGTTRRDFKLYFRLSVVMGLTWLTGLIGGYFDIAVLWYIFVALNTFQGLFIFLCFTCNKKVFDNFRRVVSLKKKGQSVPMTSVTKSSVATSKTNVFTSSDVPGKNLNKVVK